MTNSDSDWRPSYRKAVTEGAREVRWTTGKVIGTIVVIMIVGTLLGLIASALGWFGEAAQVTHDEFGPKAALEKYSWFIDQANAIKKMDQDVKMFEDRVAKVEENYVAYGADKSKWVPDVRLQYNHERGTARDDLVGVASQRNNLVKDYNAASRKFNWSPFQTNPDKPAEYLQEYVVK